MALFAASRKNAYRTDKIGCRQQTLFFMLEWQLFFRKCPKPRKCLKQGCSSTHNTLLYVSEKFFRTKSHEKSDEAKETTASSVTVVTNKAEESPGMPSVTNFRGLFQITEVNLQPSFRTEQVLVLCGSACGNSWISKKFARKLNVQVTPLKITVHGINSHQTIDTQIVELKLTPVHSCGSCPDFVVKAYVRKDLNVGTEVIDVEPLQVQYPLSEPITEEEQLWRCRNGPWSRYVPLYPPIGVF